MEWGEVVKSNNWRSSLGEYIKIHEDILNHPDYRGMEELEQINHSLFEAVSTGRIDIKSPITDIQEITRGSTVDEYISREILRLKQYYNTLARRRSLEVLRDFASNIGVKINISDTLNSSITASRWASATFKAHDLTFKMSWRRLQIYHTADTTKEPLVNVCIYDENNLPIGDFFVSLMGLVVLQPNKLDVVQFAISYAKIVAKYSTLGYINNIYLNDYNIDIYHPFNSENEENERFKSVINDLKMHDSGELKEIEDALKDSFGYVQGWF
jgi:hypothetical protein